MSLPEVINPPNLADLAETINREHGLASTAAVDMVMHGINAGRALIAAQEQVPVGDWRRWMDANCPLSQRVANMYKRLANYEHLIGGAPNLHAALQMLKHQPMVRPSREPSWYADARKLHATGATFRQIGAILGYGELAVAYVIKPEMRRRHEAVQRDKKRARRRELAAGRRALSEKAASDRVSAAGGSIADGFALTRRALQRLDAALSETERLEAKVAIRAAIASLHSAVDHIDKAVKIS